MEHFGDNSDRSYTMVMADKSSHSHSTDELESMAVQEGRFGPATIIPIPMSPDELINPPPDMDGEFFVFYMELTSIDGVEHKLMLRERGVVMMIEAIQDFTTAGLERKIEREAPSEVVDLMKAIKQFMDKHEGKDKS